MATKKVRKICKSCGSKVVEDKIRANNCTKCWTPSYIGTILEKCPISEKLKIEYSTGIYEQLIWIIPETIKIMLEKKHGVVLIDNEWKNIKEIEIRN